MIKVIELTKKYKEIIAVDRLSFELKPGVVTGFLGPNGAGKSTTMRMILNLEYPSHGSVHINGLPYQQLDTPISEIGALINPNDVHPKRTPYQHLRIIATAAGIPDIRVHEMLDIVGLTKAAHRAIGDFSLGMQQRLGIATALLGDPKTVMLDEPFNGLDPDGIQWLRKLIKKLSSEGKCVLVSSHLMSEVQAIADRVIIIGQGKLIADMEMKDLAANSLCGYIQVSSPQSAKLKIILEEAGADISVNPNHILLVRKLEIHHIGELAAINQITLHELASYTPTLEKLFMELTDNKTTYQSQMEGSGMNVE